MMFDLAVAVAAVAAGAIAAVAGFGIGSVLTPLIALTAGTKTAVAVVAVPHAVATALRFWMVRADVDRRVLWTFGLASAAGGLAGALLNQAATSPVLAIVFGVLLLFAGVSELTGLMARVRLSRPMASVAGALSGLLGGLVGNQGGIRSAAMLGFDVPKRAYVATATAIALFVDAARLPVYLVSQGHDIAAMWRTVAVASAGVVVGTFAGIHVLSRLPEKAFRRVVAVLLLGLGATMLVRGPA